MMKRTSSTTPEDTSEAPETSSPRHHPRQNTNANQTKVNEKVQVEPKSPNQSNYPPLRKCDTYNVPALKVTAYNIKGFIDITFYL